MESKAFKIKPKNAFSTIFAAPGGPVNIPQNRQAHGTDKRKVLSRVNVRCFQKKINKLCSAVE